MTLTIIRPLASKVPSIWPYHYPYPYLRVRFTFSLFLINACPTNSLSICCLPIPWFWCCRNKRKRNVQPDLHGRATGPNATQFARDNTIIRFVWCTLPSNMLVVLVSAGLNTVFLFQTDRWSSNPALLQLVYGLSALQYMYSPVVYTLLYPQYRGVLARLWRVFGERFPQHHHSRVRPALRRGLAVIEQARQESNKRIPSAVDNRQAISLSKFWKCSTNSYFSCHLPWVRFNVVNQESTSIFIICIECSDPLIIVLTQNLLEIVSIPINQVVWQSLGK